MLFLATGCGAGLWSWVVLGLFLLGSARPVLADELMGDVAEIAGDMGWRTGGTDAPDARAVTWAFPNFVFEWLGLLIEAGDWRSRTLALTPAGTTTVLAMLRHTATGPRDRM